MLKSRIIPCLDVKNGRTVKGVQFENLVDLGSPIELARAYSQAGADELVFLDISASQERRETMFAWVEAVAEALQIPFTVGGGINSLATVEKLLKLGADKVAINTAAIEHPILLREVAETFGSQCLVLAIDYKYENGEALVYSHGGKKKTALNLPTWVKQAQELGVGELLLTAMDLDGTKSGFDIQTLQQLKPILKVPVIASGGAGSLSDFKDVLKNNIAQAALAAGTFHRNEIRIPQLKEYLIQEGIACRPTS